MPGTASLRSFPSREALRRPRPNAANLLVGAGLVALLYTFLRLGGSLRATHLSSHVELSVSTDPANIPD
jgi:NitT/TauT family transport system permease protein